jgi:superfamily II DNA or RNA helicase
MLTDKYKQNIINLEKNGRLFPNWIMKNFKKYVLPEIIREEGEDPCDKTIAGGLTLYQQFIGQYLNYDSQFKDILLYHGVGSGKTRTAINVYNVLFNYTPDWNVFLLLPASLHDEPWLKELRRYLVKNNYEKRLANIIFIHYDSPIADKDFLEKVKNAESRNKSIFIIDEVHRFINNVYNNIYGKKGKRAQIIYDYIQQEKKENNNTRVILLSATPVVNLPFEFSLIFNLLKPNILPISESIFEQIFISSKNFESLNEDTKNMFQRRIMGLVSYYIGATPDTYAQKIVHYINITMGKYQEEIYNYFETLENKKNKFRINKMKKRENEMSTYLAYTRQACNFVFPDGDKRPRPIHYKISEYDAVILEEGKQKDKKLHLLKTKSELREYNKALINIVNNFIEYINKIIEEDKNNNYELKDDIEKWKNKYNSIFKQFLEKEEKKSLLLIELYKYSPKFIRIIFNILKSKGTILVYSNYVEMEGLRLFKIYLNIFNFISLDKDKEFKDLISNPVINDKKKIEVNKINLDYDKLSKDELRFCEFHGGIDKIDRLINKEIFNKKENKYGKYCKIILISPAGAEGINLFNVRQVHIIEPYWNEAKIEQVIGRAVRFCHHKDLPMEERKVDIFRYKMVRRDISKKTSDEILENLSRKKNNLLLSFINAVKEVAIDCELFKSHNMMNINYKCFNFTQESLFDKNIGPAYNINIEDDMKNNNGLNSINSKTIRIRVKKIKGVLRITDNTFSNDNYYLLDEKTNIVYDYDLHYPIGKIEKDENNNNILLDNETYIISNIIIIIPTVKIYE